MRQQMLHLFAILLVAGALRASAQIPTFKVRSEEVRIDMLVTDQGKPVTDLRADDFEVLDNGVLQKIAFASFEQMPINATLVLDMSESVAGEPLAHLRSAGNGFIDALKKDEEAALITFGHLVSLGSPLTADLQRVKTALNQAKPAGFTSLIDACYAGLMLAESRSNRPLLVVFSDGLDTSSWLTSKSVLETAKRSNAVVYAVSVGRLPGQKLPIIDPRFGRFFEIPNSRLSDHMFLSNLSNATGGSLFEIESTGNLSAVFLSILEEFRQRYLLTYSPKDVSKSGWHELKIRVKGRNATIKARPGYQASSKRSEGG